MAREAYPTPVSLNESRYKQEKDLLHSRNIAGSNAVQMGATSFAIGELRAKPGTGTEIHSTATETATAPATVCDLSFVPAAGFSSFQTATSPGKSIEPAFASS